MALKEFIKKGEMPSVEKAPAGPVKPGSGGMQKAVVRNPVSPAPEMPAPIPALGAGHPVSASLGPVERDTLRALSALQIRYGQVGEAVPYLLMIRKTNPEDLEAARLLALAFMKLKRWEEAEHVLQQIDEQSAAAGGESWYTMIPLYRSIVSFKTRRFEQARKWLASFRSKKRGELS